MNRDIKYYVFLLENQINQNPNIPTQSFPRPQDDIMCSYIYF